MRSGWAPCSMSHAPAADRLPTLPYRAAIWWSSAIRRPESSGTTSSAPHRCLTFSDPCSDQGRRSRSMNENSSSLVEYRRSALSAHVGDATMLRPEFLYNQSEGENGIDLRKIWSIIWRNRLTILAILAASLALGFL